MNCVLVLLFYTVSSISIIKAKRFTLSDMQANSLFVMTKKKIMATFYERDWTV